MSSTDRESSESSPPTSSWTSCFRNDLFQGQVALVTGGGTGIGFAITKELASLGATVVIASRTKSKCEKAAEEINKLGYSGKVKAGPSTNIKKEEEVQALVEHVIETYGALNLLVNNSGGQFIQERLVTPRGIFFSLAVLSTT
jgi:NAD(P)-dependent dehydrogenase (short-subunit alcohol dehydrogenase family)